jgi:hypothetical protein
MAWFGAWWGSVQLEVGVKGVAPSGRPACWPCPGWSVVQTSDFLLPMRRSCKLDWSKAPTQHGQAQQARLGMLRWRRQQPPHLWAHRLGCTTMLQKIVQLTLVVQQRSETRSEKNDKEEGRCQVTETSHGEPSGPCTQWNERQGVTWRRWQRITGTGESRRWKGPGQRRPARSALQAGQGSGV